MKISKVRVRHRFPYDNRNLCYGAEEINFKLMELARAAPLFRPTKGDPIQIVEDENYTFRQWEHHRRCARNFNSEEHAVNGSFRLFMGVQSRKPDYLKGCPKKRRKKELKEFGKFIVGVLLVVGLIYLLRPLLESAGG